MKILFSLFFILCFTIIKAQSISDTVPSEEYVYKEPSKAAQAYTKYRETVTEPAFGLAKIKKLIKAIKTKEEEDPMLSTKQFLNLSLREKFTYCMIHPESYSQNCDASPTLENEDKKIFAYLPDAYGELSISDRQMKFLRQNRDSIVVWIKETANAKKRVGLNLKEAIVAMDCKELIPFLIDFYKKTPKDNDILTTLILLMENGKYKPQLNSQMHEKLYGENQPWPRFVKLNKDNIALITKRAMDFYNVKK